MSSEVFTTDTDLLILKLIHGLVPLSENLGIRPFFAISPVALPVASCLLAHLTLTLTLTLTLQGRRSHSFAFIIILRYIVLQGGIASTLKTFA